MVAKKKTSKKIEKKLKNDKIDSIEEKLEEESGVSLDDAFGDDDDVAYAESKPKKVKKKGLSEDEIEEELDEVEENLGVSRELETHEPVKTKASKPISKVKKGDKVKVDGKEYEVDAHYVLIDHGSTKEMTIELFDPKTDKDYQLRYFDDQVESTIDFYELNEIVYSKLNIKKVEW